jgi:hypothetical protein
MNRASATTGPALTPREARARRRTGGVLDAGPGVLQVREREAIAPGSRWLVDAGCAGRAGLERRAQIVREPRPRSSKIPACKLLSIEVMRRMLLLCLSACGASSLQEQPGPRGLRADQHMQVASREADRAAELAHWPERPLGGPAGNPAEAMVTGAWVGTWDTVAEHQRLAEIHRSSAAAIEAEYEAACGETPATAVSVSPLQRYGVGATLLARGIRILLSPDAGTPDALLSAMRCHRAWMMLGRSADMDDCPLDLDGIQVAAQGDADAIELTITVADSKLVGELQRRAIHDIEISQHRSVR